MQHHDIRRDGPREKQRDHGQPARDIHQGWVTTHPRTYEAGLGNDTRTLRNAFGRVELEDPITLDRSIDRIKDQPGRYRATPDHHSRNAVHSAQVTLKLVEAHRLHDVIVTKRIRTSKLGQPESPAAE